MSNEIPRTIRTPKVRLSYAHLINPNQFKEKATGKPKGDPTFNTEFIFEKDGLKAFDVRSDDGSWKSTVFNEVLTAIAKEEWPDLNIAESVKHGGMKWPVADGNKLIEKKEKEAGKKLNLSQYEDKYVIRGKSSVKYPPRLHVWKDGGFVELLRDNEDHMKEANRLFQSGNYVVAILNIKPQEVDGRKFLTLYMNDVLFHVKGERLGGVDASEAFKGFEGGSSDFDPTQGSNDESDGLGADIPL